MRQLTETEVDQLEHMRPVCRVAYGLDHDATVPAELAFRPPVQPIVPYLGCFELGNCDCTERPRVRVDLGIGGAAGHVVGGLGGVALMLVGVVVTAGVFVAVVAWVFVIGWWWVRFALLVGLGIGIVARSFAPVTWVVQMGLALITLGATPAIAIFNHFGKRRK